MESKKKRIIGDAKEEMDPELRAERDREWAAKNMDSRNPSSIGASRWNSNPARPAAPAAPAARDAWRLGDTRQAIFAKMQRLEGRSAPNAQQKMARVSAARRKVYEDMYAKGSASTDAAATVVNVEYFVDAQLWSDHGKPVSCLVCSSVVLLADLFV